MVYNRLTSGYYKLDNFNSEFYRRIIPTMLASALTCWITPIFDVSVFAYLSDLTFPKHLRVGYTSSFDALKQNMLKDPYFFYRNSFPTMLGTFVQTGVMLGIFDTLFDFSKIFFINNDSSKEVCKFFCVSITTLITLFATYPFQVHLRDMVEISQAKFGQKLLQSNYKKAL